jgi:hypothetical protein
MDPGAGDIVLVTTAGYNVTLLGPLAEQAARETAGMTVSVTGYFNGPDQMYVESYVVDDMVAGCSTPSDNLRAPYPRCGTARAAARR